MFDEQAENLAMLTNARIRRGFWEGWALSSRLTYPPMTNAVQRGVAEILNWNGKCMSDGKYHIYSREVAHEGGRASKGLSGQDRLTSVRPRGSYDCAQTAFPPGQGSRGARLGWKAFTKQSSIWDWVSIAMKR